MPQTPKTAAKGAAISKGRFPTIAFVNKATTPLGVPLDKLVAALTRQLEEHFVPVWGYHAELYVTAEPKAGEWQIVFLDDADAANALGYHDLTKDGQPISKVFVKSTLAAGQKVSTTASHELLEMLIDPGATLWAQGSDGRFYAYEMCDAVEGEEYEIDNIAVSNFVYPSFFEAWRQPRSVRFDHLNKVSQPFEILQNGYQIINDGLSVREIFVSRAKERDIPHGRGPHPAPQRIPEDDGFGWQCSAATIPGHGGPCRGALPCRAISDGLGGEQEARARKSVQVALESLPAGFPVAFSVIDRRATRGRVRGWAGSSVTGWSIGGASRTSPYGDGNSGLRLACRRRRLAGAGPGTRGVQLLGAALNHGGRVIEALHRQKGGIGRRVISQRDPHRYSPGFPSVWWNRRSDIQSPDHRTSPRRSATKHPSCSIG
ncbi:hypothetical protein [Bradyrhizobium sp. JR3.5]